MPLVMAMVPANWFTLGSVSVPAPVLSRFPVPSIRPLRVRLVAPVLTLIPPVPPAAKVKRLVLVATDLDSGEATPFGLPGWDHIPISKAVQASSALPGLFPPVTIEGRQYVDGALKKTLHASVLLQEGLDLLICLNPLVPYESDAADSTRRKRARIPQLVDGGLPLVLSQTFRSLIHSRLELGFKRYEHLHPDTDILLFEPDHRDAEMFLANTFSYSQRRHLAEHAYQSTRATLRQRAPELATQLARHGLELNLDVLEDPSMRLLGELGEHRMAAALRSLLGKGVKLHTFSKEIMDACQKSAHDVMEDIASKNAKFKKIYEPWKRFRQDQNTWMSVAEDPMNEILIRMGRK